MLSDNQRLVLRYIQLNANASVPEVARACRLRDHSVRHSLDYLLEHDVIRRSAFVDLTPLGFTRYNLFFSLPPAPSETKNRLLRQLAKDEHTIFIAEVAGDYQYELSFAVRNVQELTAFLDVVSNAGATDKRLVITTSKTMFGSKFLQPSAAIPPCSFTCNSPLTSVDQVDHEILGALANTRYDSFSQLARFLKLPLSTLHYRLHRMEREKIIAGHYYILNPNTFGMLRFKVLLQAKGMGSSAREDIFAFCRSHPNIDVLMTSLGPHDFELLVQAEDYQRVVALADQILNTFSTRLHAVKIFPTLQVHKFSDYPLVNFRSVRSQTEQPALVKAAAD